MIFEEFIPRQEKKLALLRDMIQLEEKQQEKKKSQREAQGASWKSASTARPLRRGYIDDVSTSRKKGVTSTRNGTGGGVGAPTSTALATATKAAAAASSTIKGVACGLADKIYLTTGYNFDCKWLVLTGTKGTKM